MLLSYKAALGGGVSGKPLWNDHYTRFVALKRRIM